MRKFLTSACPTVCIYILCKLSLGVMEGVVRFATNSLNHKLEFCCGQQSRSQRRSEVEVSKNWMRHQLSQLIKFKVLNHLLSSSSCSSFDPLSYNLEEDFFMSLSFILSMWLDLVHLFVYVCELLCSLILLIHLIFFSHNPSFKFFESLIFFWFLFIVVVFIFVVYSFHIISLLIIII